MDYLPKWLHFNVENQTNSGVLVFLRKLMQVPGLELEMKNFINPGLL